MLWALITALILRGQIHKTDSEYPKMVHTPGFYQLETARMDNYSVAMDKKLKSALIRHDRASDTMFYAAHNGKPRDVQNRAFARLLASDNRVLRAKRLVSQARQDMLAAITTASDTNTITNITYDLAYSRKTDLLKYQLSKLISR